MKLPKWPTMLGSKPIDLGLERVSEALERLDNPHHKLPPVIHIAGTNGKGSTLAFIRAILEAAGEKCHVYTSPHLVEFNERIVVAGEIISDEFLNEVLEETKSRTEGIKLTFFEGTTLAAILAFSKVKADYVLLETGMGGRLDATNIMGMNGAPDPMMTIITPISYDHTEFLGKTLTEIAYEKASIIKDKTPCIVSKQEGEAARVIFNYATGKNAKLSTLEKDFFYEVNENRSFNFADIEWDNDEELELPKPSLFGQHQYMNAAVAVKAALEIGIDEKSIKKGLRNAKWPARMQLLSKDLYLDGGHNPQAAEIIRDFLKEQNAYNKKKNIIILGMLKTKDTEGFIKTISNEIDEVFAVPVPNDENSRSTFETKEICDRLNIKCRIFASPDEAVRARNKHDRVIICGSLYLAGYVLEKKLS